MPDDRHPMTGNMMTDQLAPEGHGFEEHTYDVVVVGAGGAGLRAAIAAQDAGAKVAIVCKSLLGKAHTVMAEGGIAAAMGNLWPDDNWQVHFRDTMRGGKMLNHWRMAHELIARVVSPHRPSERRLPEARPRIAFSLQRAQRRSHEELEPDERRHGIAGKPEHERRVAHAERDRLPGLDRDTPEHLVDAELRGDAANQVVRSDRHAARADDDV